MTEKTLVPWGKVYDALETAMARAEGLETAVRYAYDEEYLVFCDCDYDQCRRNKARKYLQDALGLAPDQLQQRFNDHIRPTPATTEGATT